MRRVLFLTALLIFVVSTFAFAEMTKVTMLFWPGPESEAMQKVIDYYNANEGAEKGIEVEMLNFSRQGFFDKQQVALAGGTKSFDIAFPTTYIVGRLAPYLEPLDPYFEKYGNADNLEIYIDSALNSLRYDGKLYGLPTDVSHHFLYYRKDLIEKLLSDKDWQAKYKEIASEYLGKDLAPKKPEKWTWDDYVVTSLFFTKRINHDSPTIYGTTLQLKNLIFNIMIWDDILWSYGGRWIEGGKPVLNSEEAQKALDVYMKIIENKATPPASINYEFAETNQAFKSGQCAVILQWNAAYSSLTDKEQSPQVYNKVGIAPMPAGSAGHKTHVHSLAVGLNKHSDKKDEAFQFLAFLASKKAMQIYAENGGFPPVTEVLNSIEGKPGYKISAEHMEKYGYVASTGPQTVPILEVMAKYLTEAWSGQVSPKEALEKANTAIGELINE